MHYHGFSTTLDEIVVHVHTFSKIADVVESFRRGPGPSQAKPSARPSQGKPPVSSIWGPRYCVVRKTLLRDSVENCHAA